MTFKNKDNLKKDSLKIESRSWEWKTNQRLKRDYDFLNRRRPLEWKTTFNIERQPLKQMMTFKIEDDL